MSEGDGGEICEDEEQLLSIVFADICHGLFAVFRNPPFDVDRHVGNEWTRFKGANRPQEFP